MRSDGMNQNARKQFFDKLTSRKDRLFRGREGRAESGGEAHSDNGSGDRRVPPWSVGLPDLGNLGPGWRAYSDLPRSVILASVIINILGLGLPLVILQVYDRIIPNLAYMTLAMMIFGLVCAVAIEAVLRLARSYVVGWEATRFAYAASIDAADRVLNTSDHLLAATPPSKLNDQMSAIGILADFYGGQSRLVLLDVPFMLIFFTMLVLIGGPLAVIPISVAVAVGYETSRRARRLRATLEERHNHDDRRYDFVMECLAGIQTAKSLGMEPFLLRRFERLQETTARIHYQMIDLNGRAQTIGLSLANVTTILMVTIGAVLAIYGNMTIGTLAACTMLTTRMIQPLLRAISVWGELQTIQLALEQAKALFALPRPRAAEPALAEDGIPEIRVRAVSLSEQGVTLLRDAYLTVAPGEFVALRGPSYGAKSALLDLIWGERCPDSGTVEIGPYDPARQHREISRLIGFIGQKPVMFKGTILENLTLFGRGPLVDEARWACRETGVESLIHRLPAGYDTPLGDSLTEALPSGFLQRIAIARIIAQKPAILVMDEPQAFLDREADQEIIRYLDRIRGKTTIVLNSNRPSYFKLADRLFEIHDGELTLIGGRVFEADEAKEASA